MLKERKNLKHKEQHPQDKMKLKELNQVELQGDLQAETLRDLGLELGTCPEDPRKSSVYSATRQ